MSQLGSWRCAADDLLSLPFHSSIANAGTRCSPSIINTHSYRCHKPLSCTGLRWSLIKVPAFSYCLALQESVIMKNRTTQKQCGSARCWETAAAKLLLSLDGVVRSGLNLAVRCISGFAAATFYRHLLVSLRDTVRAGALLTIS